MKILIWRYLWRYLWSYTYEDTYEDTYADTFCQICGKYNDEATMLLCDKCNRGFHMYCLTPVINSDTCILVFVRHTLGGV